MNIEDKAKCNVGDTLYKLSKIKHTITKAICIKIVKHDLGHFSYHLTDGSRYFSRNFGDIIFKTKREATEALKRTEKIAQKRLLLKAYEVELNKQLDLQEHYIIK